MSVIDVLRNRLVEVQAEADELRDAIAKLSASTIIGRDHSEDATSMPLVRPLPSTSRAIAKRGAKPGRVVSEETKAKMRAAHAARKASKAAASTDILNAE